MKITIKRYDPHRFRSFDSRKPVHLDGEHDAYVLNKLNMIIPENITVGVIIALIIIGIYEAVKEKDSDTYLNDFWK